MPASDRDEALKELGRMARDRRENANLALEDIFERTRVRIEFLKGIEDGNYLGFPDPVYTRGFVRTYLSVIGAEDLKDEFISWLNRESRKEQRLPPTNVLGDSTFPTKGFKLASRFWLFVLLILILAGAAGYVWYSWENNPFSSLVMSVDRNGPVPEFLPGAASVDESSEASRDIPFSGDALLSILPASVEPEPEPEPEPMKPFIAFKTRGDAWMKVMIGEKVLISRTLTSGSEISWDLPSPAQVTYGRPNMVEVVLNGKELGVVNARGSKNAETYRYNPDGTYRKLQ
jgi:cytoskeletal protein RodZ